MKTTRDIVDYVQSLTFNDIPGTAISHIKVHLVDTIGAIIAGSSADCTKKLMSLMRNFKRKKGATVLVYGKLLSVCDAALLNSTMARGFDYEPILLGGATHVPASIIPAALNMAEYVEKTKGWGITGKDLIEGISIGLDLAWRIRVAGVGERRTDLGSGWLAETFAPIAIAALGSKLLRFDRTKTNYALSIAFGLCSGHYGATVGIGGGLMAQLTQGLGTKSGILSLLLAEAGFTAQKDIFDGRWGLYGLFGGGSYNRDILIGGLGSRFDHFKPFIKRYPGCGALQAPVEASLRLANSRDLKIDRIKEVRLKLDPVSFYLVAENKRCMPKTGADALWNCYYAVAIALKNRTISLHDFTNEGVQRAQCSELLGKIRIFPNKRKDVAMRAEIEIVMEDGTTLCEVVESVETLGASEVYEKFKHCSSMSARPFSSEQVEKILATIDRLENLKNTSQLISLLVPSYKGTKTKKVVT